MFVSTKILLATMATLSAIHFTTAVPISSREIIPIDHLISRAEAPTTNTATFMKRQDDLLAEYDEMNNQMMVDNLAMQAANNEDAQGMKMKKRQDDLQEFEDMNAEFAEANNQMMEEQTEEQEADTESARRTMVKRQDGSENAEQDIEAANAAYAEEMAALEASKLNSDGDETSII